MSDILRDLEQYFDEGAVAADEGGYLVEIAGILAPATPTLLFMAAANGTIKAASEFGTHISSAVRNRLALKAVQSCRPLVTWTTLVANERCLAFSVRLGERADNWVLGGLLASHPDGKAILRRRAAALRNCGRLASRGIQQEQSLEQLQTRIRHLLAQHDMLRAAHTEASIEAIEEHDRRLCEEKDRIAMRQVCEATQAANKAKSEFLAIMSHELRTPLNGVIGMTELLRATQLAPQQRTFVEACHASGKALLDLINDILDFSKIEAGKLELDPHPFDLAKLVKTTMETMAQAAAQKGLRLSNRMTSAASRCVLADRGRLRQVLVNLLGNAIKFTETGEVGMHVEAVDETAVRFAVCDTGIGIAPDRMSRLFESFSQADSSTTRKFGGTGLGLAISRDLVQLMGGRIGVESTAGRGSTFWFEVPLPVAADEPCDRPTPPPETAACPTSAKPLAGLRVLLAEDNRVNQMFAQEVLRQAGVECVTVENGRQAVETLQTQRFDLVLMDCQMPEMDGFEATRQIRAQELDGTRAGRIPILALTANAIKGDQQRCFDAGMNGYLTKPFESPQLIDAIRRLWAAPHETTTAMATESPPHAISSPSEAAPPINLEALTVRCLGSLEFAQSLLADFQDQLPDCVTRITSHIEAGASQDTAEAAHFLKGAAGAMLAESVRELAARIEAASKAGDLTTAAALAGRLRDEAPRCIQFIHRQRGGNARG